MKLVHDMNRSSEKSRSLEGEKSVWAVHLLLLLDSYPFNLLL